MIAMSREELVGVRLEALNEHGKELAGLAGLIRDCAEGSTGERNEELEDRAARLSAAATQALGVAAAVAGVAASLRAVAATTEEREGGAS